LYLSGDDGAEESGPVQFVLAVSAAALLSGVEAGGWVDAQVVPTAWMEEIIGP
jgi:hypothetical protein